MAWKAPNGVEVEEKRGEHRPVWRDAASSGAPLTEQGERCNVRGLVLDMVRTPPQVEWGDTDLIGRCRVWGPVSNGAVLT